MFRSAPGQALRGDALTALFLALVLAAFWMLRDWHQLYALRLPDTDDVMRLQQVRDWLAGRPFADLTQHRLAGGLPMHWTRLADLAPAAIITLAGPLWGRHAAELIAVAVWPALLFATALFLVARITRALAPESARVAIIVAALAYPATTLFMPGRIDHHGLQLVLLLTIVLTLVGPPSFVRGVTAGVAASASLVIGLEAAPLIAAASLVLFIAWLGGGKGADQSLIGAGLSMLSTLTIGGAAFLPAGWDYPACDGFTVILLRAAIVLAFVPLILGLAGRYLVQNVPRLAFGLAVGGSAAMVAIISSPECLSPYGAVDPLLLRLWLDHVGEARSLLVAGPLDAIGYAGVMVPGIVACAVRWRAGNADRRWAALLLLQLSALALTLVQLRGAYAGAMLAAPALAATIVVARRRGVPALAAAWLASAGMLYPIAAQALTHDDPDRRADARQDCTAPEPLAALATLPPGTILAPLDLGPYALAATPHRVIAAPYHRNNAGNLASYRFFIDPTRARALAAHWHVDYVALCDDSFTDLPADPAFAARLRSGHAPPWLVPLPLRAPGLHVWRVC